MLSFKLATERLEGKGNKLSPEGSHGVLWEALPAFDFLFMMLKIRAAMYQRVPIYSWTTTVTVSIMVLRS
jgi:hypothetical protein